MKNNYLTTIFIIIISSQLSYGQQKSIENITSELPKLKKESLQIGIVIDLYPNPSIDYLNVHIENSKLKDIKFEMFNIIGNKLNLSLDKTSPNSYKINVKGFVSGYYILVISDPVTNFNKAYKFRKQ